MKDNYETVPKSTTITEPEVLTGSAEETGMGEITITVSGGVEPYTVNGTDFNDEITITELNAVSHTFNVSDVNGATFETNTVTLVDNILLGNEYLDGIIYEVNGTYPNKTGKLVKNNILDEPLSPVISWVDSFDGSLDWELPTINEMILIIDLHKNNINFTLSSLIESGRYWTSEQGSCDSGYTTVVWYVNSSTSCVDNVSSRAFIN